MNRRAAIKQTGLLLGTAVSASVITGVLQGCRPTYAVDWIPAVLSPEQALLVGEIAETILPETETAGAKTLHLDEFIDLMVSEAFTSEEQRAFTEGLTGLTQKCEATTGKSLLDCTPEDRLRFLTEEERTLRSAGGSTENQTLLRIKELTLIGYFTSEYAATEALVFKPVPGHYFGCVDYEGGPAQIGMRI